MTETVTVWRCKTCTKTFESEEKAVSHSGGHRRKGPNEKLSPANYVRPVEVEPTELEEMTLYDVSGEPIPDHDPEYLTDPDPPETGSDSQIQDYE